MAAQTKNEPVWEYKPGSQEVTTLLSQLGEFSQNELEIPVIINGKPVHTGKLANVVSPHNHKNVIAKFHQAGPSEIQAAIEGSQKAYKEWAALPAEARGNVFQKAADLLATKYRPILNAATMLGQSKTVHQAEIDSACELIDFLRFNVQFQKDLETIQPISPPGMSNKMEYRPLEGFVFAVTPFNFTAIAGNLPTAPALMGNVALWKPASTSIFSSYYVMKLLEEAGLPPGVIQFIPGKGSEVGPAVIKAKNLAGIHFTGSTSVFQGMWKTVGENIANYDSYPRIVGETGGKDFVFAHASADIAALSTALIRGAFEYQGQKCSAASRAYLPKSLWSPLKDKLISEIATIKMGDVNDPKNFMSAVIDHASFTKLKGYLDKAKNDPNAEILCGGNCDDSEGYFVEPTVIQTTDPKYTTMCEELFGPVLTVFVYEDSEFEETLKLCDETSPYALTGCILAQDREVIEKAKRVLRQSAGNFYINNKPTGAVVGQQPFGGARASGTNDKAGSVFNLLRWTSIRTLSETFEPPTDYRYPFMG